MHPLKEKSDGPQRTAGSERGNTKQFFPSLAWPENISFLYKGKNNGNNSNGNNNNGNNIVYSLMEQDIKLSSCTSNLLTVRQSERKEKKYCLVIA